MVFLGLRVGCIGVRELVFQVVHHLQLEAQSYLRVAEVDPGRSDTCIL